MLGVVYLATVPLDDVGLAYVDCLWRANAVCARVLLGIAQILDHGLDGLLHRSLVAPKLDPALDKTRIRHRLGVDIGNQLPVGPTLLLERLDLSPEMPREFHRRARRDQAIGLELEQKIHLLISEVVTLVVDEQQRPAVVVTIEPQLESLPSALLRCVDLAFEDQAGTLLLVLLIERADRGEVDERLHGFSDVDRVVLRQVAEPRFAEKVIVLAAGRQIRIALIDDDLALRQPDNHGGDGEERADRRHGVGEDHRFP